MASKVTSIFTQHFPRDARLIAGAVRVHSSLHLPLTIDRPSQHRTQHLRSSFFNAMASAPPPQGVAGSRSDVLCAYICYIYRASYVVAIVPRLEPQYSKLRVTY